VISINLLAQKKFILKATATHGDRYDYSLTIYRGTNQKITIICREHGPFQQLPNNHFRYEGCKQCQSTEKSLRNRKSLNYFISKASAVHTNKFDYTLVDYINWNTPVYIICPVHGAFKQKAGDHLTGRGCRSCARQMPVSDGEYLNRFKQIHGSKYQYPDFTYINSRTKINVVCGKHGLFKILPYNLLAGNGCRKCKTSRGELCIGAFLDLHGITYTAQKTFEECKVVFPLPFDFFIEPNILIEFDGEGHFKPINWGGKMPGIEIQAQFERTRDRDFMKNKWAKENNFVLIRLPHTEDLLNALCTELPPIIGFSLHPSLNKLPGFYGSQKYKLRQQLGFLQTALKLHLVSSAP
jgi:hypothetical protein